ncbi:MAG: ATP-binding protein, partial [Cryobacterium sp.]
LTNTRKHAGAGATAEVRLRYEADAVELEVTDTGRGARPQNTAAHPGETSGLGQRGMRERVSAVGGTLELANRPRGGYLVRARVPLAPAPAPAPARDA